MSISKQHFSIRNEPGLSETTKSESQVKRRKNRLALGSKLEWSSVLLVKMNGEGEQAQICAKIYLVEFICFINGKRDVTTRFVP